MKLWKALLLAAIVALPPIANAASKQPNIVFIFTDDHALDSISAYSKQPRIETPRIDQIAKEGMIFTRSYCTNSICGPSRASVQTGLHSHRNAFFKNYSLPFDMDQTTFPKLLRKVGYQTALIGKWHLDSTPKGFDYYEILPDQGSYYNPDFIQMKGGQKRYEGYATDITTDLGLSWMDKTRDKSKPFLLMLQHKAAHRTFAPPLRYLGRFAEGTIAEPATLFDDYGGNRSKTLKANQMEIGRHFRWHYDLKVPDFNPDNTPNSGDGEYARMNEEQRKAWDAHFGPLNEKLKADYAAGKFKDPKDLTRWKYQRYMSNYLGTVAAIDDSVGRVLDFLKESGLEENTIVIYSSDQGFYLGEHGWYDKRWAFEESFAMPFLIRWPAVIKPGGSSEELIQNIDYAPTFLEVAGAEIPARMQGKSLLPLLKGEKTKWRDALFYAYYEHGEHNVPVHQAVATSRYKLIHFPATDEWNLMDRVKDPLELQSFHADPEYAKILEAMKKQFEEVKQLYGWNESTVPVARGDQWWKTRHQQKQQELRQNAKDTKLVFLGDSITQGWEDAGKELWEKYFEPLNAINLGFSGDRTEHVLWRIHNGEWPEELQPKAVILNIGTNNSGHDDGRPAEDTAAAIRMIVTDIRDRAPNTEIIVNAIFPRGQSASDPARKRNEEINRLIDDLRELEHVHVLDLSKRLANNDGSISTEIMPDRLHLSAEGYQIWAEALVAGLKKLGVR